MNTPAHLAASLLVWRKEDGWKPVSAIAVGAVLPDAPMYWFYVYQKFIAGQSERLIWSTLYFEDRWQLLFDVFNSIPIYLVLLLISYRATFQWGRLVSASGLLHCACDLPLHHDDAHRHFLPFTSWRFSSPVSYWDPQHFGHIFVWLELSFALAACAYVSRKGKTQAARVVAIGTLVLYVAGMAFAAAVWL